MTEGKQAEKSNGMDQALVLQISRNFLFQWLYVREHIAVCDDNAFRLGRGTGSKHDLEWIAPNQPQGVEGSVGVVRYNIGYLIEYQARRRQISRQMAPRNNHKSRRDLPTYSQGEIGESNLVHRNDYDSAQCTSVEGCYPLRTVFSPEDDPIPSLDVTRR